MKGPLSPSQVEAFHRDGLLVLKGFYNLAQDVEPVQRGVWRVLGLLLKKHRVAFDPAPFHPDTFDAGYMALLKADRRFASEAYDAVKLLPAFQRIACHPGHDALLSQLRGSDFPGYCARGCGIRIDNPGEERFRADWHQDYLGQLRSPDGLVFWSSLVPLTEELGPVRFCVGSHKDGIVPVHTKDPDHPDKTGAYALILQDRDARVARYPQVAPLTGPGDLVLIDFATIHASGFNQTHRGTHPRARWTMQNRYFNFLDETGIRIGWTGLFAEGVDLRAIHPELVVD